MVDDSGMTALVLMITKMPNVVGEVFLSIIMLFQAHVRKTGRGRGANADQERHLNFKKRFKSVYLALKLVLKHRLSIQIMGNK